MAARRSTGAMARCRRSIFRGGWSTAKSGEWGLRFWVVLALSQEDGAVWHYDEARKIAHCTVGPRSVAIKAERAPLLVTGHATHRGLAPGV